MRKSLVELLRGAQAHVSTERALEGIPPDRRSRRPSPVQRSLYEELAHMSIAQEDILRYTLDPAWKSPRWPEEYWPQDNEELTDRRWEETAEKFFRDRQQVIEMAENPELDLTAVIPHGEGRTYLRQVLLVADHNAYHTGSIVQIRKALGIWEI